VSRQDLRVSLGSLFAAAVVSYGAWRFWSRTNDVVRLITACMVMGLVMTVAVPWFMARQQWIRLGYRIRRCGRDTWVYEERTPGEARHLEFEGEMLAGAPSVLYLPTPRGWRNSMPEWARDRRAEIVDRITEALGRAGWTYEEGDAPTAARAAE